MRTEELIQLLPGLHLRKLSRALGLSMSTIRYHVRGLELNGQVVCLREGGYVRVYPSAIQSEVERRTYALLQHSPARKILKMLLREGSANGLTNGELAARSTISQSTASEYVGALRELGLIRRVQVAGGRWALGVESESRGSLEEMINRFEKGLFAVATDRFIDLWDF